MPHVCETLRRLGACACLVLALSAHAETAEERGEYLVTILGCGGCHTEGVMFGQRSGQWLAGSRIGIAYQEARDGSPAIVFPSNLTSDRKTGLGDWSKEDIVRAVQRGVSHSGAAVNAVMPWVNYSRLKREDVSDIADYLLTVPPVRNKIPEHIEAGSDRKASYIKVGIYIFTAEGDLENISPLPFN